MGRQYSGVIRKAIQFLKNDVFIPVFSNNTMVVIEFYFFALRIDTVPSTTVFRCRSQVIVEIPSFCIHT